MVSLSYTPFWPDFWPKEASWESELTGYLPERSALTTGEIDSFSVCYPWATSKTYWCPRLYACRDKDTTFNSRCWMFRLCVTNYVCCTRRSTESAYMQALWRHAPSKRQFSTTTSRFMVKVSHIETNDKQYSYSPRSSLPVDRSEND